MHESAGHDCCGCGDRVSDGQTICEASCSLLPHLPCMLGPVHTGRARHLRCMHMITNEDNRPLHRCCCWCSCVYFGCHFLLPSYSILVVMIPFASSMTTCCSCSLPACSCLEQPLPWLAATHAEGEGPNTYANRVLHALECVKPACDASWSAVHMPTCWSRCHVCLITRVLY